MTNAATKFEFEQRFFIIGAIFLFGFGLSALDHVNFSQALLHLMAPSVDPESARGLVVLRLMFAGGAMLVFLSALLRTWATAYLRTEVVHDMSQHSEAIVADGPYRYVRNPLYLANIPLAVGLGTLASRLGFVFMVAAMWLFVYRLILREEAGLIQMQGQSYRAYLNNVPRFWPSFVPRVPSAGREAHWGQAFAAEAFIWLFGVAVLSFAITLNFLLMLIIFASSMAIYFIAVNAVKKRVTARE